MPNGGMPKETYERLSAESKLDVLFDQQVEIIGFIQTLKKDDDNTNECFKKALTEQMSKCETRFRALEGFQKWVLGGIATGAFFLGIGATIGAKIIFGA